MCLSNNHYPLPVVDFNDTILLGLEVRNPHGEVEHICGYYNTVSTKNTVPDHKDFGWDLEAPAEEGDFGWRVAAPALKKGNAMLIAIPAEPGTVGEQSLIAVSTFAHFMQDYKRSIVPPPPMTRSRSMSFGMTKGPDAPIVVKGFDNGTYDVVIATSARTIKNAMARVDADKRPDLNETLYGQLDIVYPGFTFVLFCFSEADAAQAGCALVRYKPMRQSAHMLFLPGLDGHNGEIERGNVTLNHTLIVGSFRMAEGLGKHVTFSDATLQNRPYFLLDRVIGKIIKPGEVVPQGDFLFLLDDIRKGTFRCKRDLPPGWAKLAGSTDKGKPFFITADPPEFD